MYVYIYIYILYIHIVYAIPCHHQCGATMSCILSTVKPEVQLWDGDLSRRTKADGSSSCKRITFSDSLNMPEWLFESIGIAWRGCACPLAQPSSVSMAKYQRYSVPDLYQPWHYFRRVHPVLSVPGCLFYSLYGSSSQNMLRCFETQRRTALNQSAKIKGFKTWHSEARNIKIHEAWSSYN